MRRNRKEFDEAKIDPTEKNELNQKRREAEKSYDDFVSGARNSEESKAKREKVMADIQALLRDKYPELNLKAKSGWGGGKLSFTIEQDDGEDSENYEKNRNVWLSDEQKAEAAMLRDEFEKFEKLSKEAKEKFGKEMQDYAKSLIGKTIYFHNPNAITKAGDSSDYLDRFLPADYVDYRSDSTGHMENGNNWVQRFPKTRKYAPDDQDAELYRNSKEAFAADTFEEFVKTPYEIIDVSPSWSTRSGSSDGWDYRTDGFQIKVKNLKTGATKSHSKNQLGVWRGKDGKLNLEPLMADTRAIDWEKSGLENPFDGLYSIETHQAQKKGKINGRTEDDVKSFEDLKKERDEKYKNKKDYRYEPDDFWMPNGAAVEDEEYGKNFRYQPGEEDE